MRTLIKQLVMFAFNHGFISGATVLRLFAKFDLWSA
jgi:hypothetical protein